MRSLLLVAFVLVGCGDEDKESVAKAVEAHQANVDAGLVSDGTCPEQDTSEPAQVCDR